MSQPFRLPQGGRIDRSQPLGFTFDGRRYQGFQGDSVASALLANGVHFVGRSFKYHRPRGILGAGAEEPNALLQLGRDPRTDPNMKATQVELRDGLVAASQNRWPSLRFDVGAVNDLLSPFFPAGFYYKTFMWPASMWMTYEEVIRNAAGLGHSPTQPDPDRYEQKNVHCDVLIVGAGPAGLAAALEAGRTGARVILVEEQPEAGGALLSEADGGRDAGLQTVDGAAPAAFIDRALEQLAGMPEVRVLTRTIAFGYYDQNYFGLLEKVTDHLSDPPAHLPRQRLWKVRAKRVVLATGALERPLTFDGNDRPGILLAGAARTYVNRYGVKPGNRAIVVANNDSAYATALDLKAAGVGVETVVDLRPVADGALPSQAREAGIGIMTGHAVIQAVGSRRVQQVRVAPLSADGKDLAGAATAIDCDLLCMSGGWNPTVHLFSQARGRLRFEAGRDIFVPGQSAQAEASAGACNGALTLEACLREGAQAGRAAAEASGFAPAGAAATYRVTEPAEAGWRNVWMIPSDKPVHKTRAFVDFQNDVTAKDLKLAIREGYQSVEHMKRYTTNGMATDQGKTSNVPALAILAETLGRQIPEVGTTTFRPPYSPVTFGAFAGRNLGKLLDPARRTAMHAWHESHNAVWEDVGQWKRPWYFRCSGEDMRAAVRRESKAVRDSLGILDASTLGKIDIRGRDAAEFLGRIYTNAWAKLEPGRCRYGVMLGEDGMVIDDGVTVRLAEDRFLMSTTTGNAANVLAHLEAWLQTEWPDLQAYCTSVTEQFATATISGPNSGRLLAELSDIPTDVESFPHMSYREGRVANIPARVMRISFTGEMSFEINVPSSAGLSLWEALMEAGRKYDITPYGTETMHVLRAEKGFIIVGQETDGTVTPIDLGMDWIVSKKKPQEFVGKRSLSRSDTVREDRKQMVGLITEDPTVILQEGAQIIEPQFRDAEKHARTTPVPMLGHVTSAYDSPNVGRSIALALIRGGRQRMDQTLIASATTGQVTVKVVDPVFFDREGKRING